MHGSAAHLVDRVFRSEVPYRQWALSLPRWVRFKLAYEPKLVSHVPQIFLRSIFAWQRRSARLKGVRDGRSGSVTLVKRFGSSLNLNVHYHVLAPDGLYAERSGQNERVGGVGSVGGGRRIGVARHPRTR